MKILYITTIGGTMIFFKSFIKELMDAGHTVDLATNVNVEDVPQCFHDMGCNVYSIDCSRSPLNKGNIQCVRQIRKLVEREQYDIVHCHTPIAAACTRIACKDIRKQRKNIDHPLRVFYTAHGFHFYKGSPKKNWIIFYPIEKLCAKWTDVLITINKEDYNLAKNKFEGLGRTKQFEGCKVEYVPGVGIDVDKFANTVVDRVAKRKELGVPEDAFLLLSVGELNENKNHQIVIKALAELMKTPEGMAKNYYYVIAGQGPLKGELQNLIDSLNLTERVKLLGWRSDCAELYKVADLLVHPSLREGLPVTVMEAQAAGLPCIGSNIRGINDLINLEGLFLPCSSVNVVRCIQQRVEVKRAESFDLESIRIENINKRMKGYYGK